MAAAQNTTQLLTRIHEGDDRAAEELLALVYDELHRLARSYMDRQRPAHTLQPTALLNEAWMRLVQTEARDWRSRDHFLAVAARAMRSVLVDHARTRGTAKRGAPAGRVPLEQVSELFEERAVDLLALDDALQRLAERSERAARMVELRFFGGLAPAEVCRVLGVSGSTFDREWRAARAWLRTELEEGRA